MQITPAARVRAKVVPRPGVDCAGDGTVARRPPAAQAGLLLECLTPREREVTELVVRGATDREIARDLHISANTVSEHLMTIRRKLGAANRVSIATLYYGASPYYVPAPDQEVTSEAPVEVSPTYTNHVRGCTHPAGRP